MVVRACYYVLTTHMFGVKPRGIRPFLLPLFIGVRGETVWKRVKGFSAERFRRQEAADRGPFVPSWRPWGPDSVPVSLFQTVSEGLFSEVRPARVRARGPRYRKQSTENTAIGGYAPVRFVTIIGHGTIAGRHPPSVVRRRSLEKRPAREEERDEVPAGAPGLAMRAPLPPGGCEHRGRQEACPVPELRGNRPRAGEPDRGRSSTQRRVAREERGSTVIEGRPHFPAHPTS